MSLIGHLVGKSDPNSAMSADLQRLLQGMGRGGGEAESKAVDSAEKVHISSLALLKMLKHGTLRSLSYLSVRACIEFVFHSFWGGHDRSGWRADGSYGPHARRVC